MNRIANDLHEFAKRNGESDGEEGSISSEPMGDIVTQQEINPRILPISEESVESTPRFFWHLQL